MRPDSTGNGIDRPPLLLFMASSAIKGAYAVAPCLARLARAAGWSMDIYIYPTGLGRHFGGGRPTGNRSRGTSFIGGDHSEQLEWLALHYRVTAIGNPLPGPAQVLEHVGVTVLPTRAAVETYERAMALFGCAWPDRLLVLDEEEQGPYRINTAAYCYPYLLCHDVLAVDVSEYGQESDALRQRGVTEHDFRWVGPKNQDAFSIPLGPQLGRQTYAQFTSQCAKPHRQWAKGLLLADPELVLASIPRAAELRLVPLYGRPQIDAISEYAPSAATLPNGAWGRQFDDRDFLWLSRLGLPIQLVDPGPPLHSISLWNQTNSRGRRDSDPATTDGGPPARAEHNEQEPSNDQLNSWADEGRILVTLVYWSGMVRELDAVVAIADLLAATGLRAGLALTVPAADHLLLSLSALAEACRFSGGCLELLMASTGHGVAFESLLGYDYLSACLGGARRSLEWMTNCPVRGWWPLLDGELEPTRLRIKVRERHLVSPFNYAGRYDEDGRVTHEVRSPILPRLGLLQARPFDWKRAGPPASALRRIVVEAGFRYMVSKHRPRVGGLALAQEHDGLVVLPAVASWDGWTPFRTVSRAPDIDRIERRMRRSGKPGCLVATVDAPLWLLSGERWAHGERMLALAESVTQGGERGRMVNASPTTVARYAALIGERPP